MYPPGLTHLEYHAQRKRRLLACMTRSQVLLLLPSPLQCWRLCQGVLPCPNLGFQPSLPKLTRMHFNTQPRAWCLVYRPSKLDAEKEILENHLVAHNLFIEGIESRTTRLVDKMIERAPESGRNAAMQVCQRSRPRCLRRCPLRRRCRRHLLRAHWSGRIWDAGLTAHILLE